MKKSFAYESECHIRRGYAGALSVFNGCPPKHCLRVSVRVDWIEYSIVNIRKLVTRLSMNVTCVFG